MFKQPGVYPARGGRCRIRHRSTKWGIEIDEVLEIPYTEGGVSEAAVQLRKKIQAARRAVSEGTPQLCPRFDEYAQHWLDHAGLRPSSRRSAKGHLNNHWLPQLGSQAIDQIQPVDIKRALLPAAHLDYKTRTNILSTLRSLMDSAATDGLLAANPAKAVVLAKAKRKRKKKPPPDPFTAADRDAILAQLQLAALVYWAIRFYAGTRPGETLALEWSDYRDGRLHITKEVDQGSGLVLPYTKTTDEGDPGRSVYCVKSLRQVLDATPRQIRCTSIVASQLGERFKSAGELNKKFNRARVALGIRYRNPYNARHTCATEMIQSGMRTSTIARELGHTVEMLMDRYAGWFPDEQLEVDYEKRERYMEQ